MQPRRVRHHLQPPQIVREVIERARGETMKNGDPSTSPKIAGLVDRLQHHALGECALNLSIIVSNQGTALMNDGAMDVSVPL